MAIPPWTIELLRRGLSDVARKAGEPETLEKIKTQATEILQDLPQTAARGIDAVMRGAEAGKKSVQRWSRKHTALAVPMLNASGVLLNDLGTGVPLAESAMEAGSELLAGDVIQGPAMDERLSRRLQRLLPAGGAHAIAVTANFPAALTAFSLLVEHRQLVVHRRHAVRLPSGLALPDSFGMLLPVIQEVGSIDRIEISDFDGLESFCAIIADDGERAVELLDFSGRDAMQAVVLPVATLESSQHDQIASAESMLSAGADFVIMPGDGVCGGPPCGILVGRAQEIGRIQESNAWPSLAASDAIQAMMAVTLETAASSSDQIPVRALMSTSEENIRGRAERMATRLTGSDTISHCQITAEDARLTADGRWRFPSRQLRLRHISMSTDAWVNDLREDFPAVLATCDGDDVCIDLRWIAAADDAKLAETLGGSVS
jgi:L-seryl-tRNA(Ser) seleniumtransferase